jgi:hypothetical protein
MTGHLELTNLLNAASELISWQDKSNESVFACSEKKAIHLTMINNTKTTDIMRF